MVAQFLVMFQPAWVTRWFSSGFSVLYMYSVVLSNSSSSLHSVLVWWGVSMLLLGKLDIIAM